MNRPRWLVWVSLLSLAGACDDRIDGLALSRVEPSTATNKNNTPVEIIGDGFLVVPHSNFNDPDEAHSNATFKAALGDVALAEVTYRNKTRLTAVVPAGLGPGPHDLTVRDPDGRTAQLPEAFTILGPRDGGPDVPVMDLGPHDAPQTDGKPDTLLPDGPKPDQRRSDTSLCLTENFSTGSGKVQPKTGTWALSAGALRQSATGGGNYAVIGGVTASDYFVEAWITVHSIYQKSGWTEGASLGVRFQGGTDTTPRQYLCGIYPDAGLGIVHCSGGDPLNTCKILSTNSPSVSVGQKVLVRATIVGNQLTCELPLLGGKKTFTTGLTSGGPTLITQFTDASYDDLKVCPLKP